MEPAPSPRTPAWRRPELAPVFRNFLRFAIGLILLATAVGKFLDIPGFAAVLATYEAFPEWSLFPLAVTAPAAELLLAGWLFSGRKLFGAALVSAAMHAAYGAWAAITLARGLDLPNCGCFGIFLVRPLTWSTVLEDSAVVAASLALFLLSRRQGRGRGGTQAA